ncbi:aldehyde dehydrogenase family protein [Piscibacillus halophilus]|uniref:aldehyde dehydrogenase family protein n=1 Tax=Piscibacillus halophilus TaxID=571933 RepID=UPI002409F960|nr:aldehyde dehydrogenase family protein [Piscibacillus halophilus]
MLSYKGYLDKIREESKNTYPLKNPHNNELIEEVPECPDELMEAAISKADDAFQSFKNVSSHERASILDKTAQIVEDNLELFATTISMESAKPIKFAKGEVSRTVETLKFSAIEAKKLEGESIPLDAALNGKGRDAYTIYQPIGVVGAITPFNFPLNLVVHKAGPAIAAGNTIVVKPAEQTPLSSILLREAFVKAGLPEDAFIVVTGEGPRLGQVLLNDERVQKITFTGSPQVGKLIKSQAGLKKVTLELGNNSALYIDQSFEDQIEQIADKVVVGAFSYNGQVCISTQRIYVHERIAEDFIKHLKNKSEKLNFGEPTDESTDYSSLINEKSQNRVFEWIKEATENGAVLHLGGNKIGNGIEPTILSDVDQSAKLSCEEVFGPVVIVNKVNNSQEALEEMNHSQYGLNAGVFTKDLKQALLFGHELDVGQVLINDVPTLRFDHMPYGGRKNSGYGYEGVKYAIKEMVNRKLISLNYSY